MIPNREGAAEVNFVGINFAVEIDKIDAITAVGKIKIQKRSSQVSENLSIPFQVSKNKIFFFHWKNDLLGLENEAILTRVPPFQILQSQMYDKKESDLVFVLEPFF